MQNGITAPGVLTEESEVSISSHETYIPTVTEVKNRKEEIRLLQEKNLNSALQYVVNEMTPWMNVNDLDELLFHVRYFQFATEEDCEKIESKIRKIKSLKTIDLQHFGWNVGAYFNKGGREIATFIKKVFAANLDDVSISTLQRNLRKPQKSTIHLNLKLKQYNEND